MTKQRSTTLCWQKTGNNWLAKGRIGVWTINVSERPATTPHQLLLDLRSDHLPGTGLYTNIRSAKSHAARIDAAEVERRRLQAIIDKLESEKEQARQAEIQRLQAIISELESE